MKNFLYIFYNKLSARYETVMSFPSDGYAINQVKKMKVPIDEYDLCRIGSYNIETGVLTPEPPVRLVLETEEKLPVSEAE